jgi:hypothetical protein
MSKWDKIISSTNFIGLLIGLIYMLFIHKAEPATSTIKKETIKIYDSTKKVLIPKIPASLQTFCLVPVPLNVDTAAILRNFFAIYTYSQSLGDTTIRAELFDTISQNKILGRKFTYKLIQPIKTIESATITQIKSNQGLYLGGFVNTNLQSFGIGTKLSYQFKNNLMLGYDYDLVRKTHGLNLQKKIKW